MKFPGEMNTDIAGAVKIFTLPGGKQCAEIGYGM